MTRDNRGRHKGHRSRETRRWFEVAETADWLRLEAEREETRADRSKRRKTSSTPPAQPPWLDRDEYAALLELRGRLQRELAA